MVYITQTLLEEDLEENKAKHFPRTYLERTNHAIKHEKNVMQKDIDDFVEFTRRRKFSINMKKSSIMRINFSKSYDFNPVISIDEEELEVVRTTKILGITIDDSLKWDSHVDQICEKARKRIWLLRRMMNVGLDYEIILDVYNKEIRSV